MVLDFDYQNKVVEVSMRDTLIDSATKAAAAAGSVTSAVAVSKKNKSSKTTAITATAGGSGGVLTVMGSRVRARVELVKPR